MGGRVVNKQRCIANDRKGTRCGRMAPDGKLLCHIHERLHAGQSNTGFANAPFDPADKLRKIAANDRHPGQLQAIKQLMGQDTTCPRCAERGAEERVIDDTVSRMTPEQKARLSALLAEVRELQAAASTQSTPHSQELPCPNNSGS
jgi:hypothetical protein